MHNMSDTAVLESVRHSTVECLEAESAATDVVEAVVEQATQQMISNHLDRLAIPYTVRCVVKETLDFIQTAFVGQDTGRIAEDHWHVDPMATPVVIDPWARGAVSVAAKKPVDITLAQQLSAQQGSGNLARARSTAVPPARAGAGAKAAGGRAGQAAASPAAAGAAGPSSHASPSAGTGGARRAGGTKRAKGDATSGGADNADGKSGGTPASGSTPVMSPEEAEYAAKVRAEQKQRAETRALAEKVSKGIDDVKQGNFTVDGTTGKVITLHHFDGAAANAKRTDTKFNVGAAPTEPLAPVKAPPGKPSGNSTRPGGKPRQRRPEAAEFFTEEASYGPMIDALQPSGGVAVRDGETTKKADLKLPKSKVSRSEFQKLMASQPTDFGGAEPQPIDAPQPSALQKETSGAQHQSTSNAPADRVEAVKGPMRSPDQSTNRGPGIEFKSHGGGAQLPVKHHGTGGKAPVAGGQSKGADTSTDLSPRARRSMAARAEAQRLAEEARLSPKRGSVTANAALLDDDGY